MSIYDSLNEQQREAVYCTEGPLLILAGAGSGKTRVLTHRIAYLIEEMGINPWNIMAITFTNKAAEEMRERVDKLVGFGSESVWVSTFHSSCVRILRRYIDRLGYDTNFTIYDTAKGEDVTDDYNITTDGEGNLVLEELTPVTDVTEPTEEVSNEENPNTSDSILLFLGLTIVGFVGTAFTYKKLHN